MKAQHPILSHLHSLPLFPLPDAVLFPAMRMPLHIFEPRYREMVRDAHQGKLPIAIGLVRMQEEVLVGPPQVHPVAGVGVIDALQKLPDGRFMIELVGRARVRIIEETQSQRSYRTVRAEALSDAPFETEQARPVVARLRRLILGMQAREPEVAGALSIVISGLESPGDIADAIGSVLHTQPVIRQAWLEESDPILRLASVIDMLQTFIAMSEKKRSLMN